MGGAGGLSFVATNLQADAGMYLPLCAPQLYPAFQQRSKIMLGRLRTEAQDRRTLQNAPCATAPKVLMVDRAVDIC